MKACNQCGKCCVKFGANDLSASTEDISWWDHFKPHIFKYVKNGNIWFDPISGLAVERCPWLREQANNIYTCDIYQDRPEDCKLYPSTITDMISVGCEMLETLDLKNIKHAERKLYRLMNDSWYR